MLAASPAAAALTDLQGCTPLHLAAAAGKHASVPLISLLLSATPVAAGLADAQGRLPLHMALLFDAPAAVVHAILAAHPEAAEAVLTDSLPNAAAGSWSVMLNGKSVEGDVPDELAPPGALQPAALSESEAAAHEVEVRFDACSADGVLLLDGGRTVEWGGGPQAARWARTAQPLRPQTAQQCFWSLQYNAEPGRSSSCVGVVGVAVSSFYAGDITDYDPRSLRGFWVFQSDAAWADGSLLGARGPLFDDGDTLGLLLDRAACTLSLYVNGVCLRTISDLPPADLVPVVCLLDTQQRYRVVPSAASASSDAAAAAPASRMSSRTRGSLPDDESSAAEYALELKWDPASSKGAVLSGGETIARGTDGLESWVKADRGISRGRAYWKLQFDANQPKKTTKKSAVGVISEGFEDMDDYSAHAECSWIFTNDFSDTSGRAYANGERFRRPNTGQLYDYYSDSIGFLLDADAGLLGLYAKGRLRMLITGLPRGTTFYPAAVMLDGIQKYEIVTRLVDERAKRV